MALLLPPPLLFTPALLPRTLCLATFPPALLLLILHGILSESVNPALGLIPLAFSALLSAAILHSAQQQQSRRSCNCNCNGGSLAGHPAVLIADVLAATGLLLEWILTLVFMPRWAWPMLGTYCTWFLLLNLTCHASLVLKHCLDALSGTPYYPPSCPQCHFAPLSRFRGSGRVFLSTLHPAYQPLIVPDGTDETEGVEHAEDEGQQQQEYGAYQDVVSDPSGGGSGGQGGKSGGSNGGGRGGSAEEQV
ncbi:hypothetical protein EJ05DRAFT_528538 [Pseudovirgaria hyperparasitica]|uniref:Uncharacterized protein n=1 Tax=Pseudovirgaria hyperparasitica TaxID=470096 RepID=A0A6A6W900_9PEZI|nr:uncharacterized protein EJ05DRAFT_528538 [Pseudovirgaria hyperparasitica]KAF2758067.1 hypothetical protein EJ05DRAFT_528538 [Pseudovirgaria hyperparasitica]